MVRTPFHRWLLVGALLIAGLPSPAWAGPEVTFKFSSYSPETVDSRPGHWLEFRLELPKELPLSERSHAFTDLWNYLLITHDAAMRAEPKDLANALEFELDEAAQRQLAVDVLRFGAPEILIQMTEAFEAVADQGLLSFPASQVITYRQFLPLPPAVALDGERKATMAEINDQDLMDSGGAPLMSGTLGQAEAKQIRATLEWAARRSQVDPDKLLRLNSRNVIAALMSYRSEEGELPPDLTTLLQSKHLLVPLQQPPGRNPLAQGNTREKGSMYYERTAINVGVMVLTFADSRVEREVLEDVAPKPGVSPGILAEQRDDFTEEELATRRYVFQIGMLLKVFYHERGYLPSTVTHLELLRFAQLQFPNAFDPSRPAMAIEDFRVPVEGDYYYYRFSPDAFLLRGFGVDGREIIHISPTLPAK